MKALEGSLRRLKTDHLDIYFNHAVNDVDRMRKPGMAGVHRARQAARQDPLPRHVGARQQFGQVAGLDYAIDQLIS
jgi:aryl-alcohol dehydrogenase-like predicted oxidoreductase